MRWKYIIQAQCFFPGLRIGTIIADLQFVGIVSQMLPDVA